MTSNSRYEAARGRNPFQELYLTEALEDPDLYLTWFSPNVITGQTEALFKTGNVVLTGSNGAGKTMLLKLFSHEVQAAYLRHGLTVPITSDEPTLGIAINFVHAGIASLGARTIAPDASENLKVWALLVGDFLNYFLFDQLLHTLSYLQSDAGKILTNKLEARVASVNLDSFAEEVCNQDCWFGYLKGAESFERLRARVHERLQAVRSYINWNTEKIPDEIFQSKTEVGRPVSELRRALGTSGVVTTETKLVVTIDQYETLLHIDYESEVDANKSIGSAFTRITNSFLSRRDPTVSYKVGARPYSWGRELRTHGSDARLELGRDYQLINLDEVLSRGENKSTWIFPAFARDVAARRLAFYIGSSSTKYDTWLQSTLETISPNEELAKYGGDGTQDLVPRLGNWPKEWQESLKKRASTDAYGALLQEVWMRQEFDRRGVLPDIATIPVKGAPWDRPYWRKERKEALLSQIASLCRQRRLYAGWDTLLVLSGGNILVFLSLCREIWDLAQREATSRGVPIQSEFGVELQSQAIWNVSAIWFRKQDEFPGGASRRRFVTRLGTALRKAMLGDEKLSYPGRTGFSISDEGLEDWPDIRRWLDEAADFGVLVKRKHTTKEKDGQPRTKWYLFPVLCPNFDLPATRTKEPYYATIEELRTWLSSGDPITLRGGERSRGEGAQVATQPKLFGK